LFDGERHFSGTLTAKSKYLDLNTRNLVEWDGFYGPFKKVKGFNRKNINILKIRMRLFFTRKSGTFIVKHDLSYRLNSKIDLNY
jgi:iron complex outermembrane receptor protein